MTHADLIEVLQMQRNAYLSAPTTTYEARIANLRTLKRMLAENREELTQAICADYGNRSWHESTFAEFISAMGAIDYMVKRLKKWMKPQKRHVDQTFFPGGKSRVIPQPLGVVGIIVPWNFPINLSMVPVATALAAGNRVMVKYSENSRALAAKLIEILPRYFHQDQLAIFDETGGVGIEFSKLPFDLMMFTGSVETGKSVMAAASSNLTPVILELGGKCPAVIDSEYPIKKAAEQIIYAKQFNAGQVCLNVDYVFVPEHRLTRFLDDAKMAAMALVPDIHSKDYSSIIDDKSFGRLQAMLRDAQAGGARIVNLSAQDPAKESRKFPLHIVVDPASDMQISQRETFGPILTVRTYQSEQDVIRYVNAHNRPLALYVFTRDKRLSDRYIENIMSGGVTVNEAMLHVFQDDMPFGGVGHSGMGHYHGYEGFVSFSKLRPIFYQPRFSAFRYLYPPYTATLTKLFAWIVKFKGKAR